eukprot:scaffold4957_cov152-Amphora_coffeaeformis.AAC.10
MLHCLVSTVATALVWQIRGTDAFASYMTTNSGCLIELDPSEIIMNNQVRESPAWTDTDGSIELSVTFHETFLDGEAIPHEEKPEIIPPDRIVMLMEDLPTIVYLKVLGQQPDAQYVLQAASAVDEDALPAEFSRGQCDGNARFTGRINDEGAELKIKADHTAVWAGWASGHEAVKLLPGFLFRLKSEWDKENAQTASEDPKKKDGTQIPWTEFMSTEVGCTSVQLSEAPVEIFGRTVDSSATHAVALRVSETTGRETGTDYSIDFTTEADVIDSMVVEVTTGGSFTSTFHTAQIACAGGRLIWSDIPSKSFTVGTMNVPDSLEATTLHVRGLYAVKDQPGILYTTPTLEISHVSGNKNHGEETVTRRKTRVGPPKELDEEFSDLDDRAKAEQQEKIKDATLVDERKYRPDPQKELEKDLQNIKTHGDLHAQVKAHKERTDGLENEKRVRPDHDMDDEELQGHMREGRAHDGKLPHRGGRLIDKHHDKTENEHAKLKHAHHAASNHAGIGIRLTDQEFPTISFDSAYLSALLFFVGSTIATIQICRCASSRGPKGRLDL